MIETVDIRNAKILIVDDLEANVRLLERTFGNAGYSSLSSTMKSDEVCKLHRKNRYDLILLDLAMPGMDGFQVMEGLKEIETGGYLPVLVVTAQPEHRVRALKAGAKDFVSKPLDLAEVLTRAHNMIEVRLLHLQSKRLYEQLVAEQNEQKRLAGALQEAMVRVTRDVAEPQGIVAKSSVMEQLLDLAHRGQRWTPPC